MAYSSRQMQCMNAMGLVAWTSKRATNSEPHIKSAEHSQAESSHEAAKLSANESIEPASSPIPAKANELGTLTSSAATKSELPDWISQLANGALVEFSHRGKMVSCTGNDNANLIVFCDHELTNANTGEATTMPLSNQCMQLFDLMMRSIGLARNNVRMGLVATPDSVPDSPSPASIVLPQCQAVLLLDGSTDSRSEMATQPDNGRMPQSQLPVWRIAHPQLLLDNPLLKRRAWNNLKAVKRALAKQNYVAEQ